MRAVRAQDGSVYHISKADLPTPPTLEALHAVLSEYAAIPISALIVMHPNGRQTDRTSVGSLLANEADDSGDESLVYLFDREALAVDLDSDDGKLLLEALDLNSDHVLDDVGHDPDKQYDASIDLIQCIRHQHQALRAAIANLERHRGGRQDLINAYQHFASPLLTKYANLLAIYPSCMSLAEKVRVSAKMLAPSSSSSSSTKERLISEFVSKEKMENVRDGCRRIYNEITRQNRELEDMLLNVASTTEKLKTDVEQAYNVDDLLDCEKDANEAHARLKELFSRPGQRSEEEEDELDGLFDECIGRLRYLVDRRNVETRQLLHSLQEIAKIQGQIASAPVIINSLNGDLRTKCDTFKHLERLQLLVPAYAASLAESVRRRLFTKALGSSSAAYAELFGSLSNEERRRRGIYQAEWAGKLPWELPGLDEGLAFIEVELRSSNPSLGSVKPNQPDMHVTMEDLEALEEVLVDIKENLSPEDMPSNGLQHPVQDALNLIKKLKKNIETLKLKFEKLNSKLEDPDQSPTTSVSVSNSANEALQAVEERRMQLERELQAERGAREAEVAALQIKNSELERQLAEHLEHKAAVVMQHKAEQDELVQEHKMKTDDLQADIDRLSERAAQLAGKNTMQQSEASRLRQQLQDAQDDAEDLKRRLAEEETRSDHLEKRKQDLLQSLNEKDRLLRDHRTESELDRATLEKELAEVKEKLDALERESAAHASSLSHDLEKLKAKVSTQENDNAELQTMCDERGRSISEMLADAQSNKVKIATLLHLCQGFHQQCQDFLTSFVRKEAPKFKNRISADGSASLANTKTLTVASSIQVQPSVPKMASLDQAIEYMESRQPYEMWELARAHCEHCISETFLWQKQCKRYKQRADKAVLTSKEKLAFTNFQVDDLALFLPTKNISERTFAAFNYGKPNHFLKPTGRLIEDMERKDWIVGKITSIKEAVVDAASDGVENNPYLLRPGSKYSMLEAEYWPTRSSRRSMSTQPMEAETSANVGAPKQEVAASPEGAFLANPADVSGSPPEEAKAVEEDTPKEDDVKDAESPIPGQTGADESKTGPGYAGNLPSTMDFSVIKGPEEDAVKSAAPTLEPPARSGTSSLSSSRPKDLPVMLDPSPAVPPLPEAAASIQMTSPDPAGEEPAFLAPRSPEIPSQTATSPRVIPRATSLTASKQQQQQHSMAFSRSFGSSNGSGGSSGLRNRLSSSSFLTPSKALPTVASSPGVSSYMSSRTSPSPASPPQAQQGSDSPASRANRYTQTIGRYSSRGNTSRYEGDRHSRVAPASGASAPQSSARELLRSFTASSSTSGT